ncbi:MAG: alpha/beta hydrolase [Gammaproteobacteria bacterium]|nr:alpha/beta hydrolase [Gammaproteobacteria bacterium]
MKNTLVLIPGVGANEMIWQHQKRHLENEFDIRIVVANQSNDRDVLIETILDPLPDQFYLCGHSFGGWLAQIIASTYPKRVKKLILINTWSRCSQSFIAFIQDVLYKIETGIFKKFVEDTFSTTNLAQDRDNKLTLLKQMLLSAEPQSYVNQYQAILKSCETVSLLSNISASTLIIHSKEDSFFSLKESQFIKQNIPIAKLALLHDCGHNSPLEQPQAITALVDLWLTI